MLGKMISNMKIIIIEDDVNIRQDLSLLLISANYEVSVIERFDCLPEQIMKDDPDLILLDVKLPERFSFHNR